MIPKDGVVILEVYYIQYGSEIRNSSLGFWHERKSLYFVRFGCYLAYILG